MSCLVIHPYWTDLQIKDEGYLNMSLILFLSGDCITIYHFEVGCILRSSIFDINRGSFHNSGFTV